MRITSGLMLTSSRQNGTSHDRLDDLDALVKEFKIFRLMRRAPDIRVGGISLLLRHLVSEPGLLHELGHLFAPAEFVDEVLVQPWFVNAKAGVREQPVSIEPLDVIAFERAAITPDVDASSFIAPTRIVPVTARPIGVVLK